MGDHVKTRLASYAPHLYLNFLLHHLFGCEVFLYLNPYARSTRSKQLQFQTHRLQTLLGKSQCVLLVEHRLSCFLPCVFQKPSLHSHLFLHNTVSRLPSATYMYSTFVPPRTLKGECWSTLPETNSGSNP